MNETENQFTASDPVENEELRDEVQSLRAMLTFTLIILIIFSLCLDVYFFKQVSLVRQQTENYQQMVASFPVAQASDFWNKANDYAKTHPDYEAILAKYRPYISQFSAPNSPAPPAKK